jgi:replicative DNA helicase
MRPVSETPREAAEAAVLGAVLMAETALDAVTDAGLRPGHFRRPQYEALYAAMLGLRDAGVAVDALTLKARFQGAQSPVTAGDIELLAFAVPQLGNVRDYARIVIDGAWFDNAQDVLYNATAALHDHDREALAAAVASLDALTDPDATEPDPAGEFLDWYDREHKGWPLPWGLLTEAIGGGLNPGEPTVIGGWSGMGKTFLLSQILRCCRKAGANVHEYANEMHGPARTARLLTAMTGIPVPVIVGRRLTAAQRTEVLAALQALPYTTTATAGWPVEQYCSHLRRHKWDVAAIDTVTNLPCSRVDEWDRACVMLADAAAQAGTHLILVSQLNLERDKGKKPPPVGRDLRNTGAWYQRARVVMFVHRDQQVIETGDGTEVWQPQSDGHVRIEKATHGDPTRAFLPVTFNPRWLRFDELDQYRHPLEAAA